MLQEKYSGINSKKSMGTIDWYVISFIATYLFVLSIANFVVQVAQSV